MYESYSGSSLEQTMNDPANRAIAGSGPAIDAVTSDRCTGCGACEDSCSFHSVTIALSSEGFYRPVIDRASCTNCGACKLHCPVLTSETEAANGSDPPLVFGGWGNRRKHRMASASGGISHVLALRTVEEHGAVAGCVMEDDLLPSHVLMEDVDELPRMQGSKYLPSRSAGIYRQVVRHASKGRKVLFTGTPCQVAALEIFLKPSFRDNVITADLICFGVPSVLPWRKHLSESFDVPVKQVHFRDKSLGWSRSLVRYKMTDGQSIFVQSRHDPFVAGFHASAFHQPICHRCPFAKLPRQGDLTLGDFWGVPQHWKNETGVSVILASTPRGVSAIQSLQDWNWVRLFPSDMQTAAASNLRLISSRPNTVPHPRRKEILNRLIAGESLKSLAAIYGCEIGEKPMRKVRPLLFRSKQALSRILPVSLVTFGRAVLSWAHAIVA